MQEQPLESSGEDPEVKSSEFLLETKTGQTDDALLERVERAIHKQTALYQHYDLVKIASEHDPIDLAHASTKLPINARLLVYRNLPELSAKVLFVIHASSPTRAAILRAVSDEELRLLIEHMPSDEAVSVLEDLSYRRAKSLFKVMDPGKARRIAALQQHRSRTVGRLMTNEFFSFPLSATVGEVAAFMREHPGVELTNWVFVLGEENELVGFVTDRSLIVNPPHVPLRRLMRPVLHRVRPDTSRDEAVELFERYHLPVLPVVDQEDRLIGAVAQADAIEAMGEIADETIASIGGTAEAVSEDEPAWRRFFLRAPWLTVTLCAGLLTATGFSLFQGQHWFIAVPFFVPLIAGMSGNVGIQCSTVIIRSMATGEISPRTVRGAILREIRLGALLGLTFGIVCGCAAYGLHRFGIHKSPVDPLFVGLAVSSGILGACFTSTLLGTLSPLLFARCRIDPALASGPIVTACNDVLSTYMYFFIAWIIATVFQAAG